MRLSLPEPHPTKPSAPARPAAPKTQGGLIADREEEGFDFPLITRAVQALTHALGHRPKPGETIPQEAVEPYLKALTGDRFDRRADADFFRHVEGVFRAAYPVTRFDAAGRMIDTPAQPIAFTPFGPAVPRQAQPGVVRANAPAQPEAGTPAPAPTKPGEPETGAKPEKPTPAREKLPGSAEDKKRYHECEQRRIDIERLRGQEADLNARIAAEYENIRILRAQQDALSDEAPRVAGVGGRGGSSRPPSLPPRPPRDGDGNGDQTPNRRRPDDRTSDWIREGADAAQDIAEEIAERQKHMREAGAKIIDSNNKITELSAKRQRVMDAVDKAVRYATRRGCTIDIENPSPYPDQRK